jgi:DNA-binding NarL/FixJ family response regulator
MTANRVLIAEDNTDIVRLLTTLLDHEADFECAGSVGTTGEIPDAVESLAVDALVLDLQLAGESSVPFLTDCRARFPHLIVVVFSGHSSPALITEVCARGADDYLVKPNDLDVLIPRLRSMLKSRR